MIRTTTAIAVALLLFTGCTIESRISTVAEFERAAANGSLVVRTVDGEEYALSRAVLTDSQITGWQPHPTQIQDSIRVTVRVSNVMEALSRQTSIARGLIVTTAVAGASAALVALMASQRGSHTEYSTYVTAASGSCPFLYTVDDHGARLVSETFAGATLKPAGYAAYTTLESYAPSNGVCRLRVTNEQPETDYIDRITLLAIDAPKGTRVLADGAGTLHVMRATDAPISATDNLRRNVLTDVSTTDGSYWATDLSVRDVTGPEGTRDTVLLRFARRAGSVSARLAITGLNSMLTKFAWKSLLAMTGTDHEAFIDRAEHNEASGRQILDFMDRHGFLHVAVRTRNGWRTQESIRMIGPSVPAERLAVLNLTDVAGDTIDVLLTSTTDLWRIDRVAFDDTPDSIITGVPLAICRALHNNGADVRTSIQSDDQKYLTTVRGDSVELEFRDVPRLEGMDRLYVACVSGYYHQWAVGSPEAHLSELAAVLSVPGYAEKLLLPAWKAMQRTVTRSEGIGRTTSTVQ
jgi:hypothetical protein